MSRRDRYEDDIDRGRRRERPRPRRQRPRGNPTVVWLIVAVAFIAVLGIALILVAVLVDWEGHGKTAGKPLSQSEQLIDRLSGVWESEGGIGRVTFQFRKDHTATLTTPGDVIEYTWQMESAAEDTLIISTTANDGGTGRNRFVFLSNNRVRLESMKENKSMLFNRKR
jgi:hypothetical protein